MIRTEAQRARLVESVSLHTVEYIEDLERQLALRHPEPVKDTGEIVSVGTVQAKIEAAKIATMEVQEAANTIDLDRDVAILATQAFNRLDQAWAIVHKANK